MAGKTQEADAKWKAAFVYARSLCLSLPLGDADELLQSGKVSAAFREYTRAFSAGLNPAYSDYGLTTAWNNGMEAGSRGDLANAERWFKEAIRRTPPVGTNGFPEAYFMLGVTLCAKRLNAPAVDQWRATLTRSGPPQPDWIEAGLVWPSALRSYGMAKAWNK